MRASPDQRDSGCCCAFEHVTRRESELVTLMATGPSNREIARKLHISKDTVAHHIINMRQRMGARNGKELVAQAYAFGIVDPHHWPPRPTGSLCVADRTAIGRRGPLVAA
jgi:DNA-binding NarL/FixJ family response regulator